MILFACVRVGKNTYIRYRTLRIFYEGRNQNHRCHCSTSRMRSYRTTVRPLLLCPRFLSIEACNSMGLINQNQMHKHKHINNNRRYVCSSRNLKAWLIGIACCYTCLQILSLRFASTSAPTSVSGGGDSPFKSNSQAETKQKQFSDGHVLLGENPITDSAAVVLDLTMKDDRASTIVGRKSKDITATWWRPDHTPPRRFFASPDGSAFYAEPNIDQDGYGAYETIPRYPYRREDLTAMHALDPNVVTIIQRTMQDRLKALLDSDTMVAMISKEDGSHTIESFPTFLPPQFPQRDRSVSTSLLNATFVGFPPTCCPLANNNEQKQEIGQNETQDCTCRSPENYPADGIWPKVTIVSAFYQFNSKHPTNMYKRCAWQTMQSSDPMVIFVEPGSEWGYFSLKVVDMLPQ